MHREELNEDKARNLFGVAMQLTGVCLSPRRSAAKHLVDGDASRSNTSCDGSCFAIQHDCGGTGYCVPLPVIWEKGRRSFSSLVML